MSTIKAMTKTVQKRDKTFEVPAMHLRAAVSPASLNEDERTVVVEYTTGAKVLRFDWGMGQYWEELAIGAENVVLDRLNSGAPFLNSHRSNDTVDVIGVIEKADNTHATVRFDTDDVSEEVFRKVKNKILRHVSVGYVVHQYQDVTMPGDEIRTLRAIKWEPYEVSIVPIPADAGAGVRSGELMKSTCVVMARNAETEKDKPMPKTRNDDTEKTVVEKTAPAGETVKTETETETVKEKTETETVTDPVEKETPAAGTEGERALKTAGALEERQRQSEIQTIVRKAGIDDQDFTNKLIAEGVTIDKARAQVIDKLAEGDKTVTNNQVRVHIGTDENDTRKRAISDVMLHRFQPSKHKLEGAALDFRGMNLREICREVLELREPGSTRGMAPMEIARRALMSTSDLPEILANVASKTLRDGYNEVLRTFTPFCRQVTLPDFKQVARVALSEAPNLDLVDQGAEYKHGALGDGAEKYQLFTYGKIIGLTREAIINDDLDAITRLPYLFGAAAARKESDLVYGILTGNPNMSDGVALFHATHGNLVNAAMDIAGLGSLRAAMRGQKGPQGLAPLNIEGKFLIVPAARETAALQITADFAPNTTATVNPYRNAFTTIVEARLDQVSTTNYYVAADPNSIDTIEYAYLEGTDGPYIEMQEGFQRDGVEWKIRHDFAAKAIDYRGLQKSSN